MTPADAALQADAGTGSARPADSLRDELLAGIRAHRAEFEAAGERSEQLRTLPADTVAALRDLGVFWLKTPVEFGGRPLNPVDFCDVIEELAYADASTAWTAMIGAGCGGLASGWLPESGLRRMFTPDGPLPVVAGQLQPRGTGRPVPGGYTVTGRWSFASGIAHASWIIGAFRAEGEPAAPDSQPMVVFVLPKDQAEVIDNWHVAGLQGTGSMDFRVDEQFVPHDLTYQFGSAAVRGGDLFRLGMPAFVSNEVPPFCLGMARRALDDTAALAARTTRWAGGAKLSERAVFLKELGRAEVKIKAARLAHRDAMQQVWATASGGTAPSDSQQLAVTTASVYAVETCAEVISDLFRYGGGRVLALSNSMQRHLRNALAARQHIAVSEEFYEAAGQALIKAAEPPASG
jgi:indole-3-acetate monooxygenase